MDTRLRVWLTRHAESATPHLFHGAESDVGLSLLGEQQAIAAGDWFQTLQPTRVISSAMKRAVQTAAAIAKRWDCPHILEPLLHERRIGELCGTRFSMSEGPWAETLHEWTQGRTNFTTPGAESYDELRDRLLPCWERLTQVSAEERLVIVTHGVVCKVLLLSLLPDGGPQRWDSLGRVQNLATTELVRTPRGWHAEQLLIVPPPVARLNESSERIHKSEA